MHDNNRLEVLVLNLSVFLTHACNLRCSYCRVRKSGENMAPETARLAVDFALSRAALRGDTTLHLKFLGGEPLLRPRVVDEVKACARSRAALRFRRRLGRRDRSDAAGGLAHGGH
ncbi:MAG: radical SAM protein [Acetobacteraceae bacterium]|nr:radical SAM protein [Acetobacteraceae bacterium]